DAWACMRAAELFALAGDDARAHTWAKQALERAPEASARADFWRRLDALDTTASELTAYAELALDFGDAEQALTLARRAAAAGESAQAFAVALALGRAVRARGDARAASAALEQAYELASGVDERARAALELGELALSRGDRQAAQRFASDAASSSDAGTRLMASNLVGKLLLAEARWQEAEAHFARDEHDAHRVGNEREALRARLNRAIAILSRGARSEARGLLELVLSDGERIEDRRAVAFALANLSTLATLGHDYGSALSLLERAIDEVRALGDAERLARLILNLAELRLRLGLVREADQALAFARQACGAAMMGSIASLASFVAARAQLASGNTLQAAAHLRDAVAAAERGSNGAKASECHRLGVRIALEDGDLPRAERHLTIAQQSGGGPDSEAELALLTAKVERASGKRFGDEAARALALASGGDDHELMRQAHVICAQWAQDEGDRAAFQRHVQAAARLRDTVAGSLSHSLRDSFLARRELAEQRALESGAVVEQNEPITLRSGPPSRTMVGGSRVMRVLRTAIAKIGRSDATVLVLGESGTGKELVADAIHAASDRASGPMVKMNCAALVETLLLSELFGHEKGAFTGAVGRKRGRFEQAHGGTIFLDEIGDISPKTQVALLRVLQERSFERVGGHTSVEVDVRVVCATHRDLRRMVDEGTFREDLYYRLCGVSLQVPALRERIEDLSELCQALLSRIASEQGHPHKRLSGEALESLARHGWPGNVRELENALRAASLFAEGETIVLRDVTDNVEGLRYLGDMPSLAPPPSHTRMSSSPTEAVYAQLREGTSLPDLKRTLERACIERALDEAGGNITKAAQLLGMKRPRLSQLVNQYSREGQEVAK
ncbi:MAG TPA: sigma-54 dependent transcriptional regulator, partial [Polyangiaceae bacterium]|nr:sigma-54 dependent transcriptional regulator [Polyangiaceae bacterium]